jgi:hypothetical protein
MTPQQEKHLRKIKERFSTLVDDKYRKGQKEHGGDLFEKNKIFLVDCAIDEAIDQVVYLLTLKDLIGNNRSEDDYLDERVTAKLNEKLI